MYNEFVRLNEFYYYYLQIPVEGAAPEARHSHSAFPYQGGVVVFGGLDRRGVPLGDTVVLRPTERGFSWERIEAEPPPVPRSVVFQSSVSSSKRTSVLLRKTTH